MGIRFRRSIKIAPGLKVNINKKSIGITAGVRGAHASINTKGDVTKTVGIPGSGLSYVDRHSIRKKEYVRREPSVSAKVDVQIKQKSSNPIWPKIGSIAFIILAVILLLLGLISFYPPADTVPGIICIMLSVICFIAARHYKQKS
ncbi:DUF4236 domain-containing protein [Emergencia sp.]|uniref:DUF4236 domain-containing protein n=1 Tax=Emergencia sp. TaxID=1926557 RepID=UPI003AEF881D